MPLNKSIEIKFTKEESDLINHAIALGETENYREGIDILLTFFQKYKYDFSINFLLGKLYFEHDDYLNATKYFRRATKIKPKHELASIGLFHSLYDTKRKKKAFEELDRYLTDNHPKKMYKVLLEEFVEQIGLDGNFDSLHESDVMVLKHYIHYYPPMPSATTTK